jgi:hypothetical protein
MRLPLVLAALAVSAPSASQAMQQPDPAFEDAVSTSIMVRSTPLPINKCGPTRAHLAEADSAFRGPLRPRKLGELPPATAYMAVFRTVDGCVQPMTVVEYRGELRR